MLHFTDFEFNVLGMTPRSTFKPSYTEQETSYYEYYKNKYNIEIRDLMQFLLISKAKERDLRAGQNELIYLIPELSRATGLTDAMRANFKLMQDLSAFTRLSPDNRIKQLHKFNKRIQSTPESINVLNQWKMELDQGLISIPGRELPTESILFGNTEVPTSIKGDWQFRNGLSMYKSVDIKRWVVIYPKTMQSDAENFLSALQTAASEMQCTITEPIL